MWASKRLKPKKYFVNENMSEDQRRGTTNTFKIRWILIVKLVIIILCVSLFIYQLNEIYQQYVSKQTNTGQC